MEDLLWKDKVDGQDDILAEDINGIANYANKLNKGKVEKVDGKGLSTNDYTDEDKEKVANAVDEDTLNEELKTLANYANTIKETASGEVVAITDISPIEHNVGVKLSSVADLNVLGGNIYNPKGRITPNTRYGLTIEYLEDEDCYLLNGTTTVTSDYYSLKENILAEGYVSFVTNVISGSVDNPNNKYAMFYIGKKDSEDGTVSNWTSVNITSNKAGVSTSSGRYIGRSWFYISEGITFNNLKVQISIQIGKNPTLYEPYIEPTTYTANEDGTVEGVKSIYPNMTLYADTSGVIVNAEYNADTKKYIDNKFAELQALILEG